jgi:predicted acylesterase/phospholipase RssA
VLAVLAQLPSFDYRRPDRQIRQFLGCSVGAFFALAAFLRCDMGDPDTRERLALYMSFFDRGTGWPTSADVGGMSLRGKGDDVVAFLDDLLLQATGLVAPTFDDLRGWNRETFGQDELLSVFVTTLESGSRRLDHRVSPHVRVSVAVFSSACIPILFEPRPIAFIEMHPNRWMHTEHAVDGAVGGDNYPVRHLDDACPALGVRICSQRQDLDFCAGGTGTSLYAMVRRLINLGVGGASAHQHEQTQAKRESGALVDEIQVDVRDHDPLNCSPSDVQRARLFEAGVDACLACIKRLGAAAPDGPGP